MRPLLRSLSLTLLVGCLIAAVAVAGEQECDGPYKGRRLTPEELETILRNHQAWLMAGGKPNDERRANLCQADLHEADLQEANLWAANLQGADLHEANLEKAFLFWGDLQKAHLQGADLRGAHLQGADLWAADLQEANLIGAALGKANFEGANLASIVFELRPGPFPDIRVLAHARNLTQGTYGDKPRWVELREAFKKAGLRAQERQVTYAIKREERLEADLMESAFHFILFELPSDYGMSPGRALQTLGLLIVLFSVPYMVAVTTRREAGIWMVWLPERVHKAAGEANPVRVTSAFLFSPLKMWAASRWRRGLARGLSVLLVGLYFSLLSAFSIGWRELNVGTWIARVQPREYTLRPTGWVRTVSGIQSLLSVYLLALWVLTYFGRPFE